MRCVVPDYSHSKVIKGQELKFSSGFEQPGPGQEVASGEEELKGE